MTKPVVHFIRSANNFIVANARAEVIAIDHPRFAEGTPVYTSTVQQVNEDGSFETLNTMYVPYNQLNG